LTAWYLRALSCGSWSIGRTENSRAADGDPLAPCWVPSLLALEVTTASARPKILADIRLLIREMSVANPVWGAPRIHGELLKLGIDVGQTTVAKYVARRRKPPSQGWKTFLPNHADCIASMDLFVVPTISFRLLCGFLILQHSRRELVWLGVTERHRLVFTRPPPIIPRSSRKHSLAAHCIIDRAETEQ